MCPTFVSNKGLWYAAKEKIGGLVYAGKKAIKKEDLPESIIIVGDVLNPGDPFMYDGADREALKMLGKEGFDLNGDRVIGQDFRHNTEFIQSIRTMGFNTVDEYLKFVGFDEKEDDKRFKEKAERTKSHEVERKVNAIEVLAGGKDMANPGGESELIGGFGEERMRSAKEAKKLERV
jgi:hypothetical protein